MSGRRARRTQRLITRLSAPLQQFLALESASSLLLLAMTVLALAWANSPWAPLYEQLLHVPLAVRVGGSAFELSLGHFVNDALMAVFFFVVGLEIKRELVIGELSSLARALLPAIAALGGMLVPAALYASLHWGAPTLSGWGIPMATDIAFAVAALAIFGPRVPPGLKVFLLALAIADDIGAVAVIAIFYTAELSLGWLAAAASGLLLTAALGRAGVRSYAAYGIVGCAIWLAMHESGVHATIAGVLLGFLTPAHPAGGAGEGRRGTESPLDELVHALHPWVAFGIMPAFALCNAGVALDASTLASPSVSRVALGVALGLLLGKPVGVVLFAWLAVRLGLAELPRSVGWPQVLAAGLLAGIGFTVALFIASLAFEDASYVVGAKIGILTASATATLLGIALLARVLPSEAPRDT